MNVTDIIAEINKLTVPGDAQEIGKAAYERVQWLNTEGMEPDRQKLMYTATLDWPIGSRVRVVRTGYATVDGREGTLVSLQYPPRGQLWVKANVKLDGGRKGPRSLQYSTEEGCISVFVILRNTPAAGWVQPGQIELIE